MTLSTRLTIAMVALVLVTAAAIGFFTYRNIEGPVLRLAFGRVETHARLLAAEIESQVRSASADVQGLPSSPAVAAIVRGRFPDGEKPFDPAADASWRGVAEGRYRGDLPGKQAYLQYRIIGVADGGREIVRVDRSGPGGAVRAAPAAELKQVGDMRYFRGTIRLGSREIYTAFADGDEERVAETSPLSILHVGTPILDPNGKSFGIAMIDLDIARTFDQARAAMRPGDDISLVTSDGKILLGPATPFESEVSSGQQLADVFPQLVGMLNANKPSAQMTADASGRGVGAAIVPVRLGTALNVVAIETTPRAAIMTPINVFVTASLISGLIAVLAAAILAVLFARSLARPIEQMTQAVAAFGRDEWMAVPASAGGEIGVLARAFERMAKEVRSKAAALRESAARQEAVFASPLIGILTLNESGSIESLNPEAERIFGCAGEALMRRDIARMIAFGDDEDIGSGARLQQFITLDGEPRELLGRGGDGSTFPIEYVLAQMPIGRRRMFVMFVRNISQRKLSQRLKDDFVATVSHELRTPLTSIAGSLGLLIGGATGKLPAAADRLLSIAYSNSQRLVRLINDILDIEKIESGKVTFVLKPIDLRPLIEQAIEANRGFAHSYGIRIRLDPAASNAVVRADVDRIIQVVTNLLSNAVKFSPSGAEIEVAIENRGEAMRVSVRDHGPGIPDDFKARIFEKFAQADCSDARRKGGTGLGLNIVKQIVTQHGGSVGFVEAPRGGTIFYFELPCFVGSRATSSAPPALSPEARVLVCDDDAVVSASLAAYLRQAGFAVDVAQTAAEALMLASGTLYAAFLIDLALPDLDGISLLQQLRSERRHAETPTVVISASPERGLADLRSPTLNILDWLHKPVDVGRLVRVISRAMAVGTCGRPRILHVDDDRDVLHVVAETLRTDADIVSVSSIEDARRALAGGDFDLALLDLALADGFGLDLLAELHDQDGYAIPVVVFSAQDANPIVAARVDAMLTKSRISIDRLVGILRRVVADKGAHAPSRAPAVPFTATPNQEVA